MAEQLDNDSLIVPSLRVMPNLDADALGFLQPFSRVRDL
jgi:hypothetical protein